MKVYPPINKQIFTIFYVFLIFTFNCIGVKNSKNSNNLGLLALLSGGTIGSTNSSSTQNGNPLTGTGNGTSNEITTHIQASSGGTITLGSEVSLTVQADTIEQNQNFSIKKTTAPTATSEVVPIQNAYQFGPEDLNFFKTATLKICYNSSFLQSNNLNENTVQIYYVDPTTNKMVNVGGTPDLSTHCVTGQIEHFSTYVVAAQTLTSTAPVVGGANFLPATPIAGMPLIVRSQITDFEANGTGTITSAFFSYRIAGSGSAFTKVPLQPDYNDASAQRYTYKIPASIVTTSGIEYFFEARDNLNKYRRTPSTGFTTKTITRTLDATTPLRFSPTTTTNISAGFARDFTIQAKDSTGVWQNIFADTYNVSGSIGIANNVASSVYRFRAQTVGNGTLDASVGGYPVSANIKVHAGILSSIQILDSAGAIITLPISVVEGQNFSFDALGYDNYGNSVIIKPTFTVNGGVGSINSTNGIFTAAHTPNSSGTLTANLDGFTDTVDLQILPNNFPVGGIVTGLITPITIQNNGGDDLILTNNGGFSFATNVLNGSSYNVTIVSQAPGQFCEIANANGTMSGARVTNISVSCIKDWLDVGKIIQNEILNGGVFFDSAYFNSDIYLLFMTSLNNVDDKIRLAKINSSGNWTVIGEDIEISRSLSGAYPKVTISANGIFITHHIRLTPVNTYPENYGLRTLKWNGIQWEILGGQNLVEFSNSMNYNAMLWNDKLVICYNNDSNGQSIICKKRENDMWTQIGNEMTGYNFGTDFKLLSSNGELFIIFPDYNDPNSVRGVIMKYNGTEWMVNEINNFPLCVGINSCRNIPSYDSISQNIFYLSRPTGFLSSPLYLIKWSNGISSSEINLSDKFPGQNFKGISLVSDSGNLYLLGTRWDSLNSVFLIEIFKVENGNLIQLGKSIPTSYLADGRIYIDSSSSELIVIYNRDSQEYTIKKIKL